MKTTANRKAKPWHRQTRSRPTTPCSVRRFAPTEKVGVRNSSPKSDVKRMYRWSSLSFRPRGPKAHHHAAQRIFVDGLIVFRRGRDIAMAEKLGGDLLVNPARGQEAGHGPSAILRRHVAPDVGAVHGIPERIPEATVGGLRGVVGPLEYVGRAGAFAEPLAEPGGRRRSVGDGPVDATALPEAMERISVRADRRETA